MGRLEYQAISLWGDISMKTNGYLIAATVAALCALGNLASGQTLGMGPMGYAPNGSHPAPVVPISYGVAPAMMAIVPAAQASAQEPLAEPSVPVVNVGDGEKAVFCSKDDGKGGKGGKSTCGPCFAVYGDFLYLRARDAEVAYAVAIDGPITAPPTDFPIQVSPVGVLDTDFQPSFRVGCRYILDPCNAMGAEYTFFEANTQHAVGTQFPDVVRSLVSHPGTQTAAQDFLTASGEYHLSHDILDGNYYSSLSRAPDYQLTAVYGIRAMQHEQRLQVDFAGSGTETVTTDIDFYGAGLRAGLEYDKFISCQWLVYAKGFGNLVPGEFSADYDQSQSYDSVVVDTGWKAGRLVTIWDLELGLSWLSKCGNYRLNAGYMFSAWTNMVQTDEWIAAVQQNSFIDMDSTMSYDGFVARMEARF
jgi:hypothetical protein